MGDPAPILDPQEEDRLAVDPGRAGVEDGVGVIRQLGRGDDRGCRARAGRGAQPAASSGTPRTMTAAPSGLGLWCEGQGEANLGSPAGSWLGPNAATLGLRQPLADRQPDAHSAGLLACLG